MRAFVHDSPDSLVLRRSSYSCFMRNVSFLGSMGWVCPVFRGLSPFLYPYEFQVMGRVCWGCRGLSPVFLLVGLLSRSVRVCLPCARLLQVECAEVASLSSGHVISPFNSGLVLLRSVRFCKGSSLTPHLFVPVPFHF